MTRCSACGLRFGSVSSFDKHRVGKHGYTHREGLALDPPRDDGRRCLTERELDADGWRRDARGSWRQGRKMILVPDPTRPF